MVSTNFGISDGSSTGDQYSAPDPVAAPSQPWEPQTPQEPTLEEQIMQRLRGFERDKSHSTVVQLWRTMEKDDSEIANRALLEALKVMPHLADIPNENRLPAQYTSAIRDKPPVAWAQYLSDLEEIAGHYLKDVLFEGVNIAEAILIVAGRVQYNREKTDGRGAEALRTSAIAFLASRIPFDFNQESVAMMSTKRRSYIDSTTARGLIVDYSGTGYENLPVDDPRVRDVLVEATRIFDSITGS